MDAQAQELFYRAEGLPYGPSRIACLEEAESLVAATGEVGDIFNVRQELCMSAAMGGRPELGLVALSHCLAAFDQHPDLLGRREYDLLWAYKNVASSLSKFVNISLQQIEGAMSDYERRLKEAGYGPRSAHSLRRQGAFLRGEMASMEREFERWQTSSRDAITDCYACEIDWEVHYHYFRREWEEALEAAQPILAKRVKCAAVPHVTYPMVMLAHIGQGDHESARDYVAVALRLVKPQVHTGIICVLLEALLLLGEMEKAVRFFERMLLPALQCHAALDKLWALAAGRDLLEKLLARGTDVRFRLPKLVDNYGLEGRRHASELLPVLTGMIDPLAAAFNARNGNEFYAGNFFPISPSRMP